MTTHSNQSLLKDPPDYTNCHGGMTLQSRGNKFIKAHSDCLLSIAFGDMDILTRDIFKLAKENTLEQD